MHLIERGNLTILFALIVLHLPALFHFIQTLIISSTRLSTTISTAFFHKIVIGLADAEES